MSLTAAQIVTDALSIAKAPGFTAQGGRALNLVLSDLVQHWNLKVNLKTASIAVAVNSNGPFNLESDYLRTYDLSFTLAGEPYFLRPGSLEQYDAETQKATTADYPYEWATDLSAVAAGGVGSLYIYPQSNSAITLQHRYFLRQSDITTPETSSTVPWFPDAEYLVHATSTLVMKITDDTRWKEFQDERLNLLRRHLLTEGDEQQVVKEIRLDPRRFRAGGSLRPTKVYPW